MQIPEDRASEPRRSEGRGQRSEVRDQNLRALEPQMLNPGCWLLDPGIWLLDTGKIGGVSVKEGKESNQVLEDFPTKAIMPQVQIFQCASLQFLRCESSGVHHFAKVPQAL